MESIDFGTLFQGFGTMIASGWFLASARMFLGADIHIYTGKS